ncbi:MAG: aspartate-semialdehyde dehydrogenase [Thermoplasmata archaeon]|nr:aspartate-semialdehyde dehydrogenase [Thermoplasmata archaeon]NIS13213.1 aspartate-semialdehyde dehydrogenase [Thermoplasmata archaeon]NIS21106.1 aspartate-semialdehyde dehydrogenase [Thermoplasmata archaeon]NIT78581.1 aspartate-semialdehyde dehydrogenase [Thermoplasmata archaeon]NIU50157.1 aspartate-semialdehyde dehydrogenase [Thermoplasmata archaeon]
MGRIPCAVLGASGMVGSRFIKSLHDHPWFSLDILAGSEGSAGSTLRKASVAARELELANGILDQVLVPPDADAIVDAGIRVAFSSMPASVAGPVETRLAQRGVAVFSNARSHRYDPHVPILVPEVNPTHMGLLGEAETVFGGGFIVCNSNCTTAGVVMALAPLMRWGIEDVTVASYQALSGAGLPGPSAIHMVGNVLPHIDGEEPKMVIETHKILGTFDERDVVPATFAMHPTCVRVPTAHGHLLVLQVRIGEEVDESDLRRALHNFSGVPQQLGLPTAPDPPIMVRLEDDRPQPQLDIEAGGPGRAEGMAVSVGRLRVEGDRVRMVALVHNLVRGAAGGSVLNAELAHAYKYV